MRCHCCDKVFNESDWEVHPLTHDWEVLCRQCIEDTRRFERNEPDETKPAEFEDILPTRDGSYD
jgi:hypothetical protein